MRIASLLMMIVVVALGLAVPAQAADDRLGLSRDGATWTSAVGPLFDADVRWVPGDVRTESFFVRNQSTDVAQLSIDVLGSTVDELVATGDLVVSASTDGGPWRSIDSPGRHRLVQWVPQRPDQVRRVDVRVAFDPASTNQSQLLSLDLDLLVTLRQALPTTPVVPGDGETPPAGAGLVPGVIGADDGILPNTGAPAFWSGFVGAALVVSGLIVALKRRQEEELHV